MKKTVVSYTLEEIAAFAPLARKEAERLAGLPDETIDLSDIPELTEEQMKTAVRGRFYRPLKKQITASVDADVLAWLKADGKGYQTRMNAILRKEMLAALKQGRRA